MRIISFLLISSWLFLGSSCKKDDPNNLSTSGPATIDGQVVDNISGKPLANALIHLQDKDAKSWMGIYQLVDTTVSDANGNFHFSYNYDPSREYNLKTTRYYYIDNNDFSIDSKKQKSIIRMDPYGWVHFYVKYQGNNSKVVTQPNDIEVKAPRDSDYICAFGSNPKGRVIYTFFKNSNYQIIVDTLVIPPLDTIAYRIYY